MSESPITHQKINKIKAEWTKSSKNERLADSSSESDKLEIVEDEIAKPDKIEILEQIVIYPIQKSVKCHFCDKNFDKAALEEHQKIHERTFFNCTDCNKKFRRKSSLRKHLNFTHKGKFKYECQECNVTFIDLTKFELHNNTKHKSFEAQRRFRCQDLNCDKSFASAEYLKRHQVTHKDEFKYKCDVCDQKFKWMTSLQTHQSIHSSSKSTNECKVCLKHFYNSRTLERHQKIHKSIRFKCNLCEKVVSNRKDNIRRHIRHLHADVAKSEIASLIETIQEPSEVQTETASSGHQEETDRNKPEQPQVAEEIIKPLSPLPVINNRVKVIQSVGNPNKHAIESQSVKVQDEDTGIKLPPKKKAIALSHSSSSSQAPKPKYDPIQHYRKILGFSKDDDQPTTTEENTEDDEMEQEETQVFPVHWRKRTSQNFLFRR